MITYSEDRMYAYFDGDVFRKDSRSGYYLGAQKREGNRRKRLHVAVWEHFNGPIPKGMHVHHVDFNKDNNEIDNLTLLSQKDHMSLHGNNLTDEQITKKRTNLLENALPASKAWHASEEGREWHRKHGKESMESRAPVSYACDFCGKSFETKHVYAKGSKHFCSNKCKAANRRKTGADNEKKTCPICGKLFETNKYIPAKTCSSECGRVLSKTRRAG